VVVMKSSSSRWSLAQRADAVASSLQSDALSVLTPVLKDPQAYASLVVRLDDEARQGAEFSAAIKASLSDPEWELLSALSHKARNTPGEDAIQLHRWARNRVVYTVDPDAAEAILDTQWGDAPIPGEALTRLPHPDPLIVLPKPVQWVNTDGDVESYEAFGVFGVRGDRRRCSAHHPDVTHFALHFFGHVLDRSSARVVKVPVVAPNGVVRIVTPVVGMRAVISLTDASMGQRQREAVTDMLSAGDSATVGFETDHHAQEAMVELTRTGLALLVYLVSDEADVQDARVRLPRERKGSKGLLARGETRVVQVGFRLGVALRSGAGNGQYDSNVSISGPRSVCAHVRRAHLHTFRRGPGRSERFIKWLPPIAVNAGSAPARVT
jgi:hypothetical protein